MTINFHLDTLGTLTYAQIKLSIIYIFEMVIKDLKKILQLNFWLLLTIALALKIKIYDIYYDWKWYFWKQDQVIIEGY